MPSTIGIIAGSLRKASFSKKIAQSLSAMAPDDCVFKVLDIDRLPVYNQDFDDDNQVPAEYVALRKELEAMDGFIFITPEHNRSMPAVLKNVLDIGSRPMGQSKWSGKPSAVFSSSPGSIGGFGANHHLRQVLVYLNVPTMQQPEIYIPMVNKVFDNNGEIKTKETKELLQKAVTAYVKWFKRNSQES
jgi:chromate reductase